MPIMYMTKHHIILMLQNGRLPLLPVTHGPPHIHPVPQPDSLPLGPLEIVLPEGLLQHLLAAPYALLILGRQPVQVGGSAGLLDGLVGLEHDHEQLRLLDLERLVVGDVDTLQGEEVLRAQERVRQRLVGVVDGGARRLGLRLGRRRVQVRVVPGLEAQELGAEGAQVDGEVAVRGWSVGEGLREEGVEGLRW